MTIRDSRDLAVSNADNAIVSALEKAHDLFLTYSGDPLGEIQEVLDGAPDFVMGLIFKAALLTQAMETRVYPDMLRTLEKAEALTARANERERMHIAAIRAWADGDFHRAVDLWDDVLVHYPRDLLALQLAHLSDVLLGDTSNQRDRVARILHAWDESVPGYGYVLGFYAFGLEENRDFAMAEECGRRAVALNPADSYAVHAVAHVMESQGRQSGGINWMRSREGDWAYGNFANHLWWHLALYHLDLAQTDRVLDIYDTRLRSTDPSGDRYEELDAAALLWRLNLLGTDVGDRWKTLADKWEPSATDTLYAFNDVHAMMTFVADGRWDVAEKVLNAHERYMAAANDANSAMTRTVGEPFCKALKAFAEENYGAVVEALLPIRYRTRYLGGSHAQRDIIGLTLLEAALRAGQNELALALSSERTALKPTSPQNWRFAARAHRGLGDHGRAAEAEAHAVALHG
ncbi:tetratricopeptide repeat protein [Nisaea acidiphila]|uniref:Tetratricopeptide repeat protein 38 n=1 Tax=Nisaea acidiphila TaxID=1862145 RepID=A0A9J7AZ76_9PROT|nr:tetratricopeptide repeat protein [Nisaea acidiphila]UUX52082.1 tetratricopeptide repeat protein [Nisaea acidiphila]